MWQLLRWITNKVYGPFSKWYIKRDRYYSYKNITLLVKAGVFHPGLFFSTKFLLSEISKQPTAAKSVLELGAGNGLVSFYLANRGANVTATDISSIAIEGLHLNNKKLQANLHIIQSDLFDNIPKQEFNYILINPPYYPKDPKNQEEMAWYCGADYGYFYKLFSQLGKYLNSQTLVLMVLSEDCDIEQIKKIAGEHYFQFALASKKRIIGELNFIFKIGQIK